MCFQSRRFLSALRVVVFAFGTKLLWMGRVVSLVFVVAFISYLCCLLQEHWCNLQALLLGTTLMFCYVFHAPYCPLTCDVHWSCIIASNLYNFYTINNVMMVMYIDPLVPTMFTKTSKTIQEKRTTCETFRFKKQS